MTRKKWTRPLLIVLTRDKQEERVLSGCKSTSGRPTGGPDRAFNDKCGTDIPNMYCVECSQHSSS